MFFAALLAASALTAPPVTMIYVDHKESCGYGRIATMERSATERKAEKLKREIEAQGGKAKIVVLTYGMDVSQSPDVAVLNTRC